MTPAGSVALLGFGIDSLIELASGIVVGWRVLDELRERSSERVEQVERRASRLAGCLLLLLAVYIAMEAGRRLLCHGTRAEESRIGIAVTAAALLIMPGLGWAKLRVAGALKSGALRADACESVACAGLALITLVGLILNALFRWWWADPVAALVLVPLIVREGLEGWRGECCGCEGK